VKYTFRCERKEVTGSWKKFRNEEIVGMIKSRRLRWAGIITCVGEERNA
jgi:uncharacterized metal-binding protein